MDRLSILIMLDLFLLGTPSIKVDVARSFKYEMHRYIRSLDRAYDDEIFDNVISKLNFACFADEQYSDVAYRFKKYLLHRYELL